MLLSEHTCTVNKNKKCEQGWAVNLNNTLLIWQTTIVEKKMTTSFFKLTETDFKWFFNCFY